MNMNETIENEEFKVFDAYEIKEVSIYPTIVGTVAIKAASTEYGIDDVIIHIPVDCIESVIYSLRRAKKLA